MNRKQKIIVSVTGIFLVLLILVGLTYAYYQTQVKGNTNEKSISVDTKDLRVSYEDGTNIILDEDVRLVPSATPIGTKTFKVKNEGATTNYSVVIENVIVKDATTEELTKFNSNDFRYELTCTKKDGTNCNSVAETVLPLKYDVLVTNEILKDDEHSYTMTVWYKETNKDQSSDMNKTLNARINIADAGVAETNPYSSNTNSLAFQIINNAINERDAKANDGHAIYSETPLTTPGEKISLETERILSITPDDYTASTGVNSYYYRGNVENNYLEFNNMCWRIVRIEGDGSVKLTLAAEKKCNEITDNDNDSAIIAAGEYGSSYDDYSMYPDYGEKYLAADLTAIKYNNLFLTGGTTKYFYPYEGDNFISEVSKTYSGFTEDLQNKMKTTSMCVGALTPKYNAQGIEMTQEDLNNCSAFDVGGPYTYYCGFVYSNYKRLAIDKSSSLICEKNGMSNTKYQVSLLNADEVVYAGGLFDEKNETYYLRDNASYDGFNMGWLTTSAADLEWATGHSRVFCVLGSGSLKPCDSANTDTTIRPAISLIPGIELSRDSGNGTKNSPYKIKVN